MILPLAQVPGIPDSSEVQTGMAHFEGSGTYGATCGDCVHRGYYRAGKNVFIEQTGMIEETRRKTLGCKEFLRLSHKHGPKVDEGLEGLPVLRMETSATAAEAG